MISHQLSIGDIVLSFQWNEDDIAFAEPYRRFAVIGPPDSVIRCHLGAPPAPVSGATLFDSDQVWRMAVHNGRPVILLYADAARSDPDTVAIMQPDFGAGDLYVRRTDPAAEHAIVPPYPLDEILVVNLLAKGRGVLLHSCAVDDDGHGTLFLGESGAGKSTTARLWSEAGVRVLNDDRVIVRQSGGRFWAYGTPWHGDALTVSLDPAPLERVLFLRHASSNSVTPLAHLDAVSRLLVRAFPTFWDAGGMDFTLGFLNSLAASVPCYDFGFVPEAQTVAFVRGLYNG